ncbi:hypothetical protein [Pseudorhizobium flavum]|uniref:Uncharacterized protein n=1 Tax=Pseudorhizobium flavum TaxID=1335061 RepID=A0A7W9YWN6_9HYPH|nr:hypothetical protein [Pseudorhizobium flavum]MBB6179785.1 hypothetical protein [Pseudorhizobium flavum]CAD6596845.1 hypothetical protein RFYW14_00404 [Pseudorhizobium flavum]
MAESKEEKLRLWREYDNEPYLSGYTRGEFNRLPPRQKSREWQKLTQRVTTDLGYWKTCTLPACRRARACRGFLSEKQYSGEPRWHNAFPPCVGPRGARQPEVLAAFPAALGYPPEEDDGPKYNGRASNRSAEEDGEAS